MGTSFGKFQVYYDRLSDDLKKIKKENRYTNISKAFAHWYLNLFFSIDNNEIGESIIDGFGDNGIDAILIQNNTIKIFQFKYPEKVNNINKQIDETTILKLINGYKKLTSPRTPKKANENFLAYHEKIKEENIFNYQFYLVSFTNSLTENALDALENEIESINSVTGNKIEYIVHDKKKICDKIDRSQKNNMININLKYSNLQQSYNVSDEINSWVGFATATDILNSVENVLDIIFDENIRNYEGDNTVNNGIYKTSSNIDESRYFYFYHNGIVFICDELKNSTGNHTASLEMAAVVNGCQSIVSLNRAKNSQKLQSDVFVPIRIIETKDLEIRSKITEYLNSQTKIRDSCFLANNTFIRELQNDLLVEGFFLERLANEYNYKKSLSKVKEYSKDKILELEKTIQIFVAYYNNEYAAIAKRGKNELFNRDFIDDILSTITSEKVLESQSNYNQICNIITKYRRCRRTDRNNDFISFLGLNTDISDEEYENVMDNYLFVNTADLLLLNAISNIKYKDTVENKIMCAINVCKEEISGELKMSPSSGTKSSMIFEKVQKRCSVLKKDTNKNNEKIKNEVLI